MRGKRWLLAGVVAASLCLPDVASAGLLPLPDDPYLPSLPVAQSPYPNASPTVSTDAVTSDSPSVYLNAPFVEQNNSFTFGQVPSWTVDGRVLSYDDSTSPWQIKEYNLDGSDPVCLTCNQPGNDGDNGFSQERPQGDWILFQTQRGRKVTLGKPGGGGFGDQLWVMRPDGSDPVPLTGQGGTSQELTDDFHGFWSPDGTHIAWVHVSLNPGVDGQDGNLTSTVREGDWVDDGIAPPHLANIVNVLPAGSGCEVEHWSPDGSGFLVACPKNGGTNLQVYFVRIFGDGASPMAPQVQLITSDDYPSWNENATFTPDMKAVIYTSSRACASNCMMNAASEIADAIGVPQLPIDDKVVLILFLIAGQQGVSAGGVTVPTQIGAPFTTDLYLRDLYTGEIRRLTNDNGVSTQFNWDFQNKNLLWTMHTGTKGNQVTQTKIAHFVLP